MKDGIGGGGGEFVIKSYERWNRVMVRNVNKTLKWNEEES